MGDEMSAVAGQPSKARGKRFPRLAVLVIVITGIFILTVTTSRTDYIEYWSSGELLIHHADPYSSPGVFALEKAQGYKAGDPIIMFNPPWALFLLTPLGFVKMRVGLFLFTLAMAGCVFFSAQLLNVPSNTRAFAYVFAPAVASVFMGQSSPVLLLGFVLFLHLYRDHPFFSGSCLLLMAIKPHLFLIFWAVLLLDCLYRRRMIILAGLAFSLVATTAYSMFFDHGIWRHYSAMLNASRIRQGFLPTSSMLFRMLIAPHVFWLLFVPSATGILWGLWYYVTRRQVWDWKTHGMLLMLISVLAAPYSWLTDEIVLLPSILYALTYPQKRKHSVWILLAINTAVLFIALVKQESLSTRAYMWTPWAWLAWFLYSTYGLRQADETAPVQFDPSPEIGKAQA